MREFQGAKSSIITLWHYIFDPHTYWHNVKSGNLHKDTYNIFKYICTLNNLASTCSHTSYLCAEISVASNVKMQLGLIILSILYYTDRKKHFLEMWFCFNKKFKLLSIWIWSWVCEHTCEHTYCEHTKSLV